MQEEDEQSYKQHFPDHFSAFADVAELDDMPNLGDDSLVAGAAAAAAEADSGLSEAEASSAAAQQLLHGAILSDVVSLHARYAASQAYALLCLLSGLHQPRNSDQCQLLIVALITSCRTSMCLWDRCCVCFPAWATAWSYSTYWQCFHV